MKMDVIHFVRSNEVTFVLLIHRVVHLCVEMGSLLVLLSNVMIKTRIRETVVQQAVLWRLDGVVQEYQRSVLQSVEILF